MSAHLPVLVIVVPLVAAVLIPLIGRLKISSYLPWATAQAATAFCFLTSLALMGRVLRDGRISYWLGGWEPPWGIEYAIDHLSAFVLVVISFMAFAVMPYALLSVREEVGEKRERFFYSIYMLFVTGLMGIVVTGDIFNLYVFLEISSLAGYTLIAAAKKREALTASYNYLILGTIGATFILLGIGYLYMATGTLNMADLRERLPELYDSKVVLTAFAFFTVGLCIKTALFPLHTWLPNAYTHAPSAVSAVMAATATKVAAYALIRIMFTVFTVEFDLTAVPVTKILLVLSSVAIIAGSVLAVAQKSIKRMLAYSSIGQIGYVVLGAALANTMGLTGAIVHILNHALMKGALFVAAGAVLYKTGVHEIDGLRGMGKRMPVTMAAFTVAALSMIGVPLTVGFISKWYLALGALKAGMWYIVPVVLLSSLITAVYFWRVIETIYFSKSADEPAQMSEAPVSMLIPAVALSAATIFFGVAAFIPLSVARKAAEALLGVGL